MYIWRIGWDESVLVTTRVVASGASTFVTPRWPRSGLSTPRPTELPAFTASSTNWRSSGILGGGGLAVRPLSSRRRLTSRRTFRPRSSVRPMTRRSRARVAGPDRTDEQVVVEGERLVPGSRPRVPRVHRIEVLDGPTRRIRSSSAAPAGDVDGRTAATASAAAARIETSGRRSPHDVALCHRRCVAPKTTRDMRFTSPPLHLACVLVARAWTR